MKTKAWVLTIWIAIMIVLHQDVWFWTDKRLVFGFLPVGLAWHAFYSLLAAATMALLVKLAWPRELEALDGPGSGGVPVSESAARAGEAATEARNSQRPLKIETRHEIDARNPPNREVPR